VSTKLIELVSQLQAENAALRECLAEYVKAHPAAAIASWRREVHSVREDRAKALLK
jgi:cell division septum initiation protein DivIVA